jgi:hypothetical protein
MVHSSRLLRGREGIIYPHPTRRPKALHRQRNDVRTTVEKAAASLRAVENVAQLNTANRVLAGVTEKFDHIEKVRQTGHRG